jgi:hypothetical protein
MSEGCMCRVNNDTRLTLWMSCLCEMGANRVVHGFPAIKLNIHLLNSKRCWIKSGFLSQPANTALCQSHGETGKPRSIYFRVIIEYLSQQRYNHSTACYSAVAGISDARCTAARPHRPLCSHPTSFS